MSTLSLRLLDGLNETRLEDISSFVATDASGQFGLLPGHEAFITALSPGLFRCREKGGQWRYLACTGGILQGRGNVISIVAARFLMHDDPQQLAKQLAAQLEAEHADRTAGRQSAVELDRALMKRLRQWSEEAA